MKNIITKNGSAIFFAAALFIFQLFYASPQVFGGDPVSTVASSKRIVTLTEKSNTEKHLAAAQKTVGGNSGSGSGGERFSAGLTSLMSLLVLFAGIWFAYALSTNRSGVEARPTSGGRKIYGFIFDPKTAGYGFAGLFVAALAVSVLVRPTTTVRAAKQKTSQDRKSVRPAKRQLLGAANPGNEAVFKSAQQIGGDGITQIGEPVFDSVGNRYVRGGFTGSLTIGAVTLKATSAFDSFIAKYDPTGAPLWVRQGSGTSGQFGLEGATALGVDGSGNVYVGGSFVKTLTLQGGANPAVTLTDNGAPGYNFESFLAKYDANGNLLWARGGNSDSPKNSDNLEIGQNTTNEIVFDAAGNPYVTGFISGSRYFGDAYTNNGLTDAIIAKLDPTTGAVVRKQIIGGTGEENVSEAGIDAAGNLYVLGFFNSNEITFPNGQKFINPDTNNDPDFDYSSNTFIAKFDASGVNLWVKVLDNAALTSGRGIAVNAGGEVFITGDFIDTVSFDGIVLTETEGDGQDGDSRGGYLAKMDTAGNFLWVEQFGGIGESVALDAAGDPYVAGIFYDGGGFGGGSPNEEILASLQGSDAFVARYDANGNFAWAKPITANSSLGNNELAIYIGDTENDVSALGVKLNPLTNTMFVTGSFQDVVMIDCRTLAAPTGAMHAYLAELSADGEAVSCRIWNGYDPDDNDWDSPENWNGEILPANNNSVYIPYTGNAFDNPVYNPNRFVSLLNLTVAQDRVLTLENRDPYMTGSLWLVGGIIDATDRNITLSSTATADRRPDMTGAGGCVFGFMRKELGSSTAPFTFTVGTPNGYSPLNVIPTSAFETGLDVKAVQQAHPVFAAAPDRINRYWTINQIGEGSLTANLVFNYLDRDVVGSESQLKLFKIEQATPMMQNAVVDPAANKATITGVSEFSDWTLARSVATAARVTVAGRVVDRLGRGVPRSRVTLTDGAGISLTVQTNPFGYFQFTEVAAGETYLLSGGDRKGNFESEPINVLESISDLILIRR